MEVGRYENATVLEKLGNKSVHNIKPDQREHLSIISYINVAGRKKIPNFYTLKETYFLQNYIKTCESDAVMAMQPNT